MKSNYPGMIILIVAAAVMGTCVLAFSRVTSEQPGGGSEVVIEGMATIRGNWACRGQASVHILIYSTQHKPLDGQK
jgi:hypothetical protein